MPVQLPIKPEKLHEKSLSNRFWGSQPRFNFFARAKNVVLSGHLDREIIARIRAEYEGDLMRDFSVQWLELLEEITYWIARDGKIDLEEQKFFREFISIFEIDKDAAQKAFRSGARRAFLAIAHDLLSDGHTSDQDIALLEGIAKHLGVSQSEKQLAVNKCVSELLQEQLDAILDDGMISDVEWAQFEHYRRSLRVELQISASDMLAIEEARNRWCVRYGELQPIDVAIDIRLKDNEVAYYQGEALWCETRSVKGEQVLQPVARGVLVMTTDRVMLRSDRGDNKSVPWSSVQALTDHGPNDFELEKERGKSPRVQVQISKLGDQLVATAIAARLFEMSK